MRALLIDPQKQTISVMVHPGTMDAIRETIGCQMLQSVALSEGETLWCNEEALLASDPGPFFQISEPIAGPALVLGADIDGEPMDSGLPAGVLRAVTSFPDIELRGWEILGGETIAETPLGPMPVFGRKPIFAPRQTSAEGRS